MRPLFHIRAFKAGDEAQVSRFIRAVFDEFVAPDYPDEGNQFFYDWISPEKILQRQTQQSTLLIAFSEHEVAGVIDTRNNDHVSLLFVGKNFQKMGLARDLFNLALQQCKQADSRLKKFFVHASPYSAEVYEKLGFRASGPFCQEHGILYLPMEMDV